MCGITGVIGRDIENKEEVIQKMTDRIIHRGPDDQGFFVDGNVALGMRRLSIIDLSGGRQPITSQDGKLLIFFNGEIYNYKELRDKYLGNYTFKTDSDTEVILHMFEEFQEKMLPMLRGMFTFSIYNTQTKELLIARDFFGIKPLYYATQNEKVVAFGSEAKSLLVLPGFKIDVNDEAVYNYLSYQYNPLSETFFKNIFKLPPGHYLKINTETSETKIQKYWEFEFSQKGDLDENKTQEEILNVVRDSVEHHMIADVPVGSFLSGGIDSSIIATLMQKVRGDKKIKTFTVGFDTLTEGKEANETSNHLGTDHKEILVGPDEYFSVLSEVVYHFDEPVADPSAVGLYFLAREARKHVKVVLSGEGSDELFGGYNIYTAPFSSAVLKWIPRSVTHLITSLPFNFFGKNYLKRVHMTLEEWYFGQKYFNQSIFQRDEIRAIWRGPERSFLSLSSLYKRIQGLSESTQMQYIDIHTWLIGDILAKADKMTMANSLELRVPFLDMKVSELAKTLPDSFKWRGGATKYLLREAFKDLIPESTRNRRKLGFPTPVKDWFTKERQDVYAKILKNEYIGSHLDVKVIEQLISDHIDKKADNSRKIYLLLMLSLWYDSFVKINPVRDK